MALVLGWGVPGWAGEPYGGPDDPRAVRAARVAADALGAGAGARSLAMKGWRLSVCGRLIMAVVPGRLPLP